MNKKIIIFCFIIVRYCSSSFSDDNLEKFYQAVKLKPEIKISLLSNNIQIINIYKHEIISIYESRNLSKDKRLEKFFSDIYLPYHEYWNSLFNEKGFNKWIERDWDNLINPKTPGFSIPFEVDFDSLFINTVKKMKKLTLKEAHGKWYLVYGNKPTGMGGFGNGIMLVDFFGIGNEGSEDLVFSLPHEINYQIFDESNKENDTLLRQIIDEGLACYVNYIYWDKKYSPAKNIDFLENEWNWSIKNEHKIFKYAEKYFNSTTREIIGKFSRWHRYIWEGTPDRLAYFIGFRICESYVLRNGNDSWRDMYILPLSNILELSNYAEIINR